MQVARGKSIGILGALCVIAGSAALITHDSFSAVRPGQENERAGTARESMMTDAAIARISAESRGILREPPIESAPRSSEASAVVGRNVRGARPSPPTGFSFSSFHGEMPKQQIDGEVDAGVQRLGKDLDWLGSTTSIEALADLAASAGRDWSFGWIRLAEDAKLKDLSRTLQGSGAEIVGSAGTLVRARLPSDQARLRAIAGLPEVGGLGAVPWDKKLAGPLLTQAPDAAPQQQMPVFITLMTDDPDGRWRRALEDLGAVVGRYDPDIRVYAANVPYGVLEAIAAADFVLAIEPIGLVKAAHDTAVPAMGADALRRFDGSPGLFSGIGGASVPIAVMDTGLNINHQDISSHRESICGANFSWNSPWFGPDGPALESEDLWIDEFGHGTHVTGTIAGNGYVEPRFAGMAPSVQHIRFAKVLDSNGLGIGDSVIRGMDFLAQPTGCSEPGRPPALVKPLIVNMSLSATSRLFEGRGVGPRKLDSVVWEHRQLYVVAQANSSISGFSNFGASKNSLAVGAVMDSSDIAAFSSHGPTFDGRLAPQVVATGVGLHSAKGAGSRGEYIALGGTSMSSPSTAGVAALLMDAVPAYREQPALTRARLMASAIRPDAWLEDAAAFPLTNTNGPGTLQVQYGLGKVSARTSVLNRDRADGWTGGGAVAELEDGEYAYQDIHVPEGASRLDLVMTWDEPPTDTIASAVLNDLDLWLDRGGDCGATACGEHVSASRVDNVEWIILINPRPGLYRAKVAAHRVYTAPPRAALAWSLIRGASTPNLTIEADNSTLEFLEGNLSQELTLTVTADAYVAAGTRLHIDCRDAGNPSSCGNVRIRALDVPREDGVTVQSTTGLYSSIPLGEISVGESQEVKLAVVSYRPIGPEESHVLYFTASAWNAKVASVSVGVGSGSEARSGTPSNPPNDDFAAAARIEGEEGSVPLDLLLATPEPGEPPVGYSGRPAGSVWYQWTAPDNGPVRFNIPPTGFWADNNRIGIFHGDRITALDEVASGSWGSTFFAEKEQSYRIRVSKNQRGAAVDLHWSKGSRPVNDDLEEATAIEGPDGAVQGSTAGATLEPGEWFGSVAATTWYRWTAPSNGDWEFSSDYPRRVFVFERDESANGIFERDESETDSIVALRLVSSYPSGRAVFPAAAGKEYLIAVAEPTAHSSGGLYELRWGSPDRYSEPRPRNDNIASAEPIESEASSEHMIGIDQSSTVEPGEPVETGVRTKWWVWEAPEDGRYTWQLTDSGETVPTYAKLRVTVFTGSSIEDLRLVTGSGPNAAPSDFAFDAVGGQRYWIAAGFATGDITAYLQREASGRLIWGPNPSNDNFSNAVPLSGAGGSLTGSNRFATMEPSERTGTLGHSSLWWTYEAPASGWYRFWIDEPFAPWVLAVYREALDGFGPLEFLRSSHQPEGIGPDATEVVFYASAGARYKIRLGTRGGASGDQFTIRWDESKAPAWLKYAGDLGHGDPDASGTPLDLRDPSGLALNSRGTVLYVASRLGLQVFERDLATGNLTLIQWLGDYNLENNSLVWDTQRTALYANRCGVWRRFVAVDGTHRELRDEGMLSITDRSGTLGCSEDLFMDSGGSFIHTVDPRAGQLQVLAFDTPGELRHVQTLTVPGLTDALISNGDTHVYVATNSSLLVFERDGETGSLTQAGRTEPGLWNLESIVISDDDRYLFAFDDNGRRSNIFQLEKAPSSPHLFDRLPPFWSLPRGYYEVDGRCKGIARKGAPAADVFCHDLAFVVQWQPENEALVATDFIAPWQPDRFNNPVPNLSYPLSLVASSDGRHLYASTYRQDLLVFERIGVGADGYAPLGILSVSPDQVSFGPISAPGCITLEDAFIDGTHYVVHNSKWQTRSGPNAEWADVEGTETIHGLCSYIPTSPGEYRLVAEIAIDGETSRYSSNHIAP